jgi:hypothetical protein
MSYSSHKTREKERHGYVLYVSGICCDIRECLKVICHEEYRLLGCYAVCLF